MATSTTDPAAAFETDRPHIEIGCADFNS